MAGPEVGIVTVTYNSAGVIEAFLDSLLAQSHGRFKLYAIDNNSRDDTVERIQRRQDPRIEVIQNADNRGVAEGNNQGIVPSLKAGCEWVLLINNDTVFDDRLIETLIEEAGRIQAPAIVPKMMYFDEPSKIWCAGGAFNRWRAYGSVHYGEGEEDRGQCEKVRRIEYSPTCCMLIHKSVFERIGLMDETYFVYTDDNDFCLRAMKAGIPLYYTPKAKLLHKVSSLTGGKISSFTVYYNTRNRAYYVLKNLNRALAIYYISVAELYFLALLLSHREDWGAFRLRQKALWDGIWLKPQVRANATPIRTGIS